MKSHWRWWWWWGGGGKKKVGAGGGSPLNQANRLQLLARDAQLPRETLVNVCHYIQNEIQMLRLQHLRSTACLQE